MPLISFNSLALSEALLAAVDRLAYSQPTSVQTQAIPIALEKQDLLVSAATGSGKTLAFLLPVLHQLISLPIQKTGVVRALILAPTRELAAQITDCCQSLIEATELKAGLITGGVDYKRQQSLLRNHCDLVVATPGRLLEHLQQNADCLNRVEFLVLDEADRMLDMGFRDDVLAIAGQCRQNRQTLLFSATLMHYGVLKMADQVLRNYKTLALNSRHSSFANIDQQIILADDNDHKQKLLLWLLDHEKFDKALIFTNTKSTADSLLGPLRGQGFRIGVLHSDKDQQERSRLLSLYRAGGLNILLATDLAARGLDVPGINLVVNFDMPRNAIDYVHRIGRTGRVNEQGLTIGLVKNNEWNLMAGIERFLKQHFTRRIIQELAGFYQGPKKLKSSGKAAGSKAKKAVKKPALEKIKVRSRDKKNIGKRRQPTKSSHES
jgi:superfamily II DNA/RNA helicase